MTLTTSALPSFTAFFVVFLAVMKTRSVEAFSSLNSPSLVGERTRTTAPSSTVLFETSRKAFLTEATGRVAATLLGVSNAAAYFARPSSASWAYDDADIITNKLKSSAALRTVKSAQKKLTSSAVEEYVTSNDYETLKQILRLAPISEFRKAAFVLLKASPDNTTLADTYKTFIAGLERLDSLASVATRGRKLGEGEFWTAYQTAQAALQEFVVAAEQSVETTPVVVTTEAQS